MNVSTECGTLKVKAIYAESSQVSCSSGRIQLGHIHGEEQHHLIQTIDPSFTSVDGLHLLERPNEVDL